MTATATTALCRHEKIVHEKRQKYEECLLAFREGGFDDDSFKALQAICERARNEYIEALMAGD